MGDAFDDWNGSGFILEVFEIVWRALSAIYTPEVQFRRPLRLR